MKCKNCGAPLNGRECSYCEQKYTSKELKLQRQSKPKIKKVKTQFVKENQNQQFIKPRVVQKKYLDENQTQQKANQKTKVVLASIIVVCIIAFAALIADNIPDNPLKWWETAYSVGTTVENDYVEITLNSYHIEKEGDTTTLVVDFDIKNKDEEAIDTDFYIRYILQDTWRRVYSKYLDFPDCYENLPAFIDEGEREKGAMTFEMDKAIKGDLILIFRSFFHYDEEWTIKYRLPNEEVLEKIEAGQVFEDYYTVGTKAVNDDVEILVDEFYIEKERNELFIYINFELKNLSDYETLPRKYINYDIYDKDGMDYPEMPLYLAEDIYFLLEGEKVTGRTGFKLNHDITNDLYLCFSQKYGSYADKWKIYYQLPKEKIIEKIEDLE